MAEGGKLSGTRTSSNGRNSGTMIESFGRDNSEFTGSKKMARDGSEGFGGGMDDLSHSLNGSRANQGAE